MAFRQWGYENPIARRQREWARFDEDMRRRANSPIHHFDKELDKVTDHVYGTYKSYANKLLYHFEKEFFFGEEVDEFGSFNLCRSITVLPKYRQRGLAETYIRLINRIADNHGCILLAFCCPYDIKRLDHLDEFETDKEKLKELAKDFGKYCLYFDEPYSLTAKDKERRRRMRDRFVSNGWERFNMHDKIAKNSKNKRWGYAYIPHSTNEELLTNIQWRRKDKA